MARLDETHTTCVKCYKKGQIIPPIPNLLHKTIVCEDCLKRKEKESKISPNN